MASRRISLLFGALAVSAAQLLLHPTGVGAQTGALVTVDTEENFRAEPNGVLLGRLLPGTTMLARGSQGGWTRAEIEGWVWTPSLQITDQLGFDLVVSASEGENLRAEPQGAVLARLEEGTLLEELERITGWIRVRRTGWVWTASVEIEEPPADGPETGDDPDPAPERAEGADPGAAGAGGTGAARVPEEGLSILRAPGGDTVARARAGADVQVVAREGSWARVRVEGWSWMPGDATASLEAGAELDASPTEVRQGGDVFAGRVVTWELRFVSLERAEEIRTDFYEGEPFLLTRPADGEEIFVYVAIPEDRLPDVDDLAPLERLVVTGRVRVGASVLTGSPILDLLRIRREG